MKDTVCAVVVTYNRKKLLYECIQALKKQNRPIDGLYIIDNASTDKTPQFLKEKGILQKLPPEDLKEPWETESRIKNEKTGENISVFYVRMDKNTGGAGGFHEGIKRAFYRGYDWIWVMDDDAEPTENTLDILLKTKNDADVICPLIVMKDGRIQFYHHKIINKFQCKDKPAIKYRNIDDIPEKAELKKIDANAFVGPLINREVVNRVGFPKKELFIWGDDTEYTYRITKSGYKVVLNTHAFIYHKDGGYFYKKKLDKKQYWKVFHERKNAVYIAKTYCYKTAIIYQFIRNILSLLGTKTDFELFKIKWHAFFEGLKLK